MKPFFKIAAIACALSAVSAGIAAAEMAREDAVKKCWEEAHQEYSKSSGTEINTSALAKGAYFAYAACMEKHGFQP